jgi:hypothetical protein
MKIFNLHTEEKKQAKRSKSYTGDLCLIQKFHLYLQQKIQNRWKINNGRFKNSNKTKKNIK